MAIQVYEATKNGQGKPLSVLSRQFISFSYGGKNIEDFDLIAVFSNDRLNKEVYADFEDTTTNQTELDGQLFWLSAFKAGSLSFTLATDGMTQKQLEDFKSWFVPGVERELVLTEYHNRGIMARVLAAPTLSVIPFEEYVNVEIAGQKYQTRTSLYKGEITLSFVMDEPYWYSLKSWVNSLEEEDLKIVYEDGVPHLLMLKPEIFSTGCFFADKGFAKNGTVSFSSVSLLEENQNGLLLYYCGNAPSYPSLTFSLSPQFSAETGLCSLWKSAASEEDYYLRVGNSTLYFTLPELLSSYNKALNIISSYTEDASIYDLRREVRDNVYDYYARAYAILVIDTLRNDNTYVEKESGAIKAAFFTHFKTNMSSFFQEASKINCSINCKTGEVRIETKVNDGKNYIDIVENAGGMVKSKYLKLEERTLPENGYISTANCLSVKTNTNLYDLQINYKYYYL